LDVAKFYGKFGGDKKDLIQSVQEPRQDNKAAPDSYLLAKYL